MADLPIPLEAALAARLAAALDVEGKILRALETLGPVSGRDVAVVGASPSRAAALEAIGARVTSTERDGDGVIPLPDGSADAIVSLWSGFRGVDPVEIAEAQRLLRSGGRLLVVHDYGRDDVSRLRGELPEYGAWSRRDGPFLRSGFRIRVIHCWWTFEDLDAASAFLRDAFGDAAEPVAAALKRPRLSYNVAVYHRSRDGATPDPAATGTSAIASRRAISR